MFCKQCGKEMEDGVAFCPNCGASQRAATLPASTPTQHGGSHQPENSSYNTMAVVGFVVALISLFLNFWGIVGITATIFSIHGYMGCKKTGQKGHGLALTGIIIGAISIAFGIFSLYTLAALL